MSETDKSWFDVMEQAIPNLDNEDLVRVSKMFINELNKRNIDINNNDINNTVKIVKQNHADVVVIASSYNYYKIAEYMHRFINNNQEAHLVIDRIKDSFKILIYSNRTEKDSDFMDADEISKRLTELFENRGIIVYSDSTITQ